MEPLTIGVIATSLTIASAVFGIGWKLATELGGIKASLGTLIATFGLKHETIEKEIARLDTRVEKLEDANRLTNSQK